MTDACRTRLLRKIDSRRRRASDTRVSFSPALLVANGTYTINTTTLILGRPLLTRRELEILWHVAHGETDRSIAEKLYLSRRTVSSHVSNMLAKLDVTSRRDAVTTAARLGLLTRGPIGDISAS